jgi:hypothetical protein
MTTTRFDPTAGERARAIDAGLTEPYPLTDPTAGTRAQAIHDAGEDLGPVLDPTDPRCGQGPASRLAPAS